MICPACGYANEDGALFCDKCKADLEMPAPPVQAPTPMTDQTDTPAAAPIEQPIPLEPIPLEPVADSNAVAFEPATPSVDAQMDQAPAAREPAPEPTPADGE